MDECKTVKSLFHTMSPQMLLFCIDSVIVTLLQCVGLKFMMSSTHTLYGPHVHSMLNILKPVPNQQYVDRTVLFENEQEEDSPGHIR